LIDNKDEGDSVISVLEWAV